MKDEYKITFRLPFKKLGDKTYEIQHFVIEPENYRNKGIGTELLKEFITDADNDDVTIVTRPVDSKDDYVIHMYEKCGFKDVGEGTYVRCPKKA
jgi:ribosomal protein S18 acetylase RimI-like enzyme